METKKEIRKRILSMRENLSDEQRTRSEIMMTEKILGHQWFYKAKDLLIYVRHRSEMDTQAIIDEAHRLGKKVFVPIVSSDTMEFYRIAPGEQLLAGYKGILEPDLSEEHEKFVYDEAKTEEVLMIMPGAAFDRERNRIGYGKGFYDRYLTDKPLMHTIAIGFACQLVSAIKNDENDIKPMQVICL